MLSFVDSSGLNVNLVVVLLLLIILCLLHIASLLQIAFNDLTNRNNNFQEKAVTVGVGVQQALSFLRLWKEGPDVTEETNSRNYKVYPHLTAIIDVKNGVVQGITWDDACIFCSGFQCDEITYDFNGNLQSKSTAEQPTGGCGMTMEECSTKHNAGGTDCDLVLYVVWTGTDVDGKALLSSANRFSAFPAQELRNRLTQNLPKAVKDAGNPDGANTNRDL